MQNESCKNDRSNISISKEIHSNYQLYTSLSISKSMQLHVDLFQKYATFEIAGFVQVQFTNYHLYRVHILGENNNGIKFHPIEENHEHYIRHRSASIIPLYRPTESQFSVKYTATKY